MLSFKLICILLVVFITIISGVYPFIKKIKTQKGHGFPLGESLAVGIFLGAALIHMLSDASTDFYQLNFNYPLAFFLAGITFLFFLLLEHIGREIHQHHGAQNTFAILAVLMLSIHSFLAGAALGVTESFSLSLIILLAILAHKWAASFALAIQINKADFKVRTGIVLFAIFVLMTPLGIILGTLATRYLNVYPLITPIFASLAAGTFLYLGTLHGLERAVMIKQCCSLKNFLLVILGFFIMAVVAIWV